MILEITPGSALRRRTGLMGLAALSIWGTLVLSGSVSAKDKQTAAPQPADQQEGDAVIVLRSGSADAADVRVLRVEGDESEATIEERLKRLSAELGIDLNDTQVHVGGANGTMVWMQADKADGSARPALLERLHADHEKMIADFAADHPAADANADGRISPDEHSVFMMAAALKNADDVIEQFPKADADADGVLSPAEAYRLASGPIFISANVEHIADDNADAEPRVIQSVAVVQLDPETGEHAALVPGEDVFIRECPIQWLLKDATEEPTAAEVAAATVTFTELRAAEPPRRMRVRKVVNQPADGADEPAEFNIEIEPAGERTTEDGEVIEIEIDPDDGGQIIFQTDDSQ